MAPVILRFKQVACAAGEVDIATYGNGTRASIAVDRAQAQKRIEAVVRKFKNGRLTCAAWVDQSSHPSQALWQDR